jgi:hypothetical protein
MAPPKRSLLPEIRPIDEMGTCLQCDFDRTLARLERAQRVDWVNPGGSPDRRRRVVLVERTPGRERPQQRQHAHSAALALGTGHDAPGGAGENLSADTARLAIDSTGQQG